MAEPLKNLYSVDYIDGVAAAFAQVDNTFDRAGFTKAVFDEQWEKRELKDRTRHIASSLNDFVPQRYGEAADVICAVAPLIATNIANKPQHNPLIDQEPDENMGSFTDIFLQEFIATQGIDELETSMKALRQLTKYSTSEFAIRPFLIRYPHAIDIVKSWLDDPDYHVRRLCSEGTRPRLPWGIALQEFKRDPSPCLPIIDALKNDPSSYVRRSVANHLNDIGKDNPKIVIEYTHQWLGHSDNLDKILKHANRGLLKAGNTETMRQFGYGDTSNLTVTTNLLSQHVSVGDAVEFEYRIQHSQSQPQAQKLRLEYAIYFLLKNGKFGRKVFKIGEGTYALPRIITKKHSFKPISTRTYYPGIHRIAPIVNGLESPSLEFIVSL